MNWPFENISTVTIVLTFIVVILATIFLTSRLHGVLCFGPGPWGLPVIGFYPFLRKDSHIHLAELGKKYGDAYLVTLYGKLYLHIGSDKVLREAFVKNANCFQARTEEISVLSHAFKDGVTFIDGEPWRIWRKFVVQSIRELGLGPKQRLQGPVLNSLQSTIEALRKSEGHPVDISTLLIFQCTEIVRRLILGENVSKDTATELNRMYLRINLLVGEKEMLLCGPLARLLVLRWNENFKELLMARREMEVLLHKILNDRRRNLDFDHRSDFVGLYLKENKDRARKNDPQRKYFNDETFVGTLVQVYGDSGHSVGALTATYLKELASRVEVQNAIYQEIIHEIGTERLPTFEDRVYMPYTNSVFKEIERTSMFFPSLVTLVCNRDTTVSGVFVPKGTISLVNFHAINNDPNVYKYPEKFDPKRFMPNNGSSVPENPVIFGVGKRACVGEQLVRFQVFMFVIAILQNFTLQIENVKTMEDDNKSTDFLKIMDCRFLALPRKK